MLTTIVRSLLRNVSSPKTFQKLLLMTGGNFIWILHRTKKENRVLGMHIKYKCRATWSLLGLNIILGLEYTKLERF
jgi:hypothetical protein